MKSLTVYAGSTGGPSAAFATAAAALGQQIGESGLTMVYGGGRIGLMGDVARAAKAAGARVVGVMTRALIAHEQGWDQCDEMIVVESMRERKAIMEERGDAICALPGGMGTYEELFEAITGRVIARHGKPIGLLDVEGHFAAVLALIDQGVEQGFIRAGTRALLQHDTDPARLLQRLRSAELSDDPRDLLPMYGRPGAG